MAGAGERVGQSFSWGKSESSHQLETNISKVQCLQGIGEVNGSIHGLYVVMCRWRESLRDCKVVSGYQSPLRSSCHLYMAEEEGEKGNMLCEKVYIVLSYAEFNNYE